MTLAEWIGLVADLQRLILYPVEATLRVFGITRRPRIKCNILVHDYPPLPLHINAQIILIRQRWIGDIDRIQECRVRLRWRPVGEPETVYSVSGGWIDGNSPMVMVTERTLSENNPLNVVPLFLVVARKGQIRGPFEIDRVYVVDGVLMASAPAHMIRIIEPGEYWLSIDLIRGRKPPVSFRFLLSVSAIARFIRIEPAFEHWDESTGVRTTIRRPVDAPIVIESTTGFP